MEAINATNDGIHSSTMYSKICRGDKTENRHLSFPIFTVKEVDEYENLPIYCHFSVVSFCCTGSLWLQFFRCLHDIVTDTPEQGNYSG